MIDPDMECVVSEGLHWNDTGSEVTLLDQRTETLFGLAGSASDIWRDLVRSTPPAQIIEHLSARFSVPPAGLAGDVLDFLDQLRGRGWIHQPAGQAAEFGEPVPRVTGLPEAGVWRFGEGE